MVIFYVYIQMLVNTQHSQTLDLSSDNIGQALIVTWSHHKHTASKTSSYENYTHFIQIYIIDKLG